MSQISVNNLTFCYEGSFDNIFESVSFSIDTDWKLGFIGRNGKGKTTFLNLLLGKYRYEGSISASTAFDYFPYQVTETQLLMPAADFLEEWKPSCEAWQAICELDQLQETAEILYRPFGTLSPGERTKIMLAVLFSGENLFLLIDEPTNHLDQASRENVKQYLASKKGFLLVSHDRDLLDACIDHVLVLNRQSIEVQSGNFSSWWENKTRRDQFEQAENEKHLREIGKLKIASARANQWAIKNENSKIGFDPIKEPDRGKGTRPYIGAKTKKMQSRVKQMQNRISREIEEKEGLLSDLERPVDLKIMPLTHYKKTLVNIREYGLRYEDAQNPLFTDLTFSVEQGDRIALHGKNGCGKSTLLKMLLQKAGRMPVDLPVLKNEGMADGYVTWNSRLSDGYAAGNGRHSDQYAAENGRRSNQYNTGNSNASDRHAPGNAATSTLLPVKESGTFETAQNLVISYVNQDTSHLSGSLSAFCEVRGMEESLFFAILRQLDLERVQFSKHMEDYSEGQKKKVLLAASLLTPAHLYLWDEPLNYIDVFSRMQIEKLLLEYCPTMLFVEHDTRFRETIATKIIEL